MSPERQWRFRIQDILDGIRAIQEYTRGMTFSEFENDPKTVDAVIHRLMVIGEAAVHVPEEIAARAPDVEWYRMRGMRNVLVHEYFGVSRKILWDTVRGDLPRVVVPLETLLESGTNLNTEG